MSSTKIMNNNFDIWQKDQKLFNEIAKEKVLNIFKYFLNKNRSKYNRRSNIR